MNGDSVIADSNDVVRMEEGSRPPVLYFPKSDVKGAILEPTDHSTQCGLKGDANYYSVRLDDGRVFENAVWQYSTPPNELNEIADRVAFYGDVIDRLVEGEVEAA